MKRLAWALFSILLLGLPAAAVTRVMVLPFDSPKDTSVNEALGPGTMDSMINALTRIPAFIVLDRARIAQLLKGEAFQQSGMVDEATAVKLGKLEGAQAIIMGGIEVVGDVVRISARFIDGETSVVTRTEQVSGTLNDVFDLQDKLSRLFLKAQGVRLTVSQSQQLTIAFKATSSLSAYGHLQRGNRADEAQDFPAAVKWYMEALEIDPNYAEAHSNLANAFYKHGDLDEAIVEYRKAIMLDPRHASTYRYLGKALEDQGNLDDAIVEFKRAVTLNPNDAGAHNNLGIAYGKQGNLAEAVTEFKAAVTLDPNDPGIHNNLGIAFKMQGNLDAAITEYRISVRLDPKDADTHNNVGIALDKQGVLDEAIAEYRIAIRLDPNNAGAHNNLGIVFARQGKLDAAIAEFKTAIRLDPNDMDAHANLRRAEEAKRSSRP